MTFPTIPTAAAGRVLTANQADTTATRTFPNLSSLTKSSGDLLVAIIVAYQTSTGTNAAFSSWGGGFTEFHDSATSTTMAIGCAYKWSTGSETGTFTVTQAGTITGHASMILLSIPGAHASTPPEAGGRASGTTAAPDPTALNPTGWDVEDTLWIAVVGCGETATTGSFTGVGGAPANYGDAAQTGITADVVGGVDALVAFRQLAAASEDVGTPSVDTSNARNAAMVIAVRPAPTAHTQSPTDQAGPGDAAALARSLVRADGLSLGDAATRTIELTRVDALALSDSSQQDEGGGDPTPADSLAMTDDFSIAFPSRWAFPASVRVG